MNHSRRYFLLAVAAIGAAVLAALGFNTTVNPLRVTPAPWSSEQLDPYREIDDQIRTCKAGLVRTGDWQVAILGSSRPALLLDPSLPDWGETKAVNLALQAGTLPETLATFRYAADRHPLQIALVGIDPGDLTTGPMTHIITDFDSSPLNPEADEVERELRYLLGLSTLEKSFATLGRWASGERARHDPRGFKHKSDNPGSLRRVIADNYIPFAARQARERHGGPTLHPRKHQALLDLVAEARRRNIRLVLFFPPTHASYLASLRLLDDPRPDFAFERAAVLDAIEQANAGNNGPPVEFWEFSGSHPWNLEPLPPGDESSAAMDHWLDPIHAKPRVGRVMLARILDLPLASDAEKRYGTRVTRDALPSLAADLDRSIDRYLTTQPDDDALLQEHISNQTR
jgi:hypothetical protein